MNIENNDWCVLDCRIDFLEKILDNHRNISSITKRNSIIFEAKRSKQHDELTIFCCDEYVMGITAVYRALKEFGDIDIIFIGGNWNGYTVEAKEYCQQSKIGLYNADEINGGLWWDKHWDYYQKDDKGNPIYHYMSA